MIKIKIKKNQIIISGHALYDDYGKDIVCASVSSIVTTSINGILKIDNETIKYKQNNDLVINIIKNEKITDILINNMIDLLKELEEQYPKNIKINEEV